MKDKLAMATLVAASAFAGAANAHGRGQVQFDIVVGSPNAAFMAQTQGLYYPPHHHNHPPVYVQPPVPYYAPPPPPVYYRPPVYVAPHLPPVEVGCYDKEGVDRYGYPAYAGSVRTYQNQNNGAMFQRFSRQPCF